ncbi:MAG: hypothetical protein COW24_01990 [Candidatus Kerfeldbacteria bacterium CG15_BIG_FIL_POST_REV_8_21_14_020_45_12]|uniref:Uncharacterized protein n=1 Tax=Candidatus Kerfeldbacteria bacterium CG15_BIG_FIL_POST_REV_8_21_14_020_45_12 TaxID=2014247 RepID=A0A2M7H4C7_9BACT|nr:MAG: hypothetical protein COW24_01990 [Candidatus Kerfeldbacteria bacterium CG15_BIG_FIL_POST_REV_8_21_14_020_45_12]PJA93616.1 MAG: hypothetical protein CO132_02190 [Candidatus Kerfeldbacteria bacterium CG_4_9_14_3_um_filter_45_8]
MINTPSGFDYPAQIIMRMGKEKLNKLSLKLNLYFITALPAIGTASILGSLDNDILPFLLFLPGIAVVAIYIASTASYIKSSSSWLMNLIFLVDGPVTAAIFSFAAGSAQMFFSKIFFVECIGALAGLFILTLVSSKPTKQERLSTLMLSGLPLIGLCILFWNYEKATGDFGLTSGLFILTAVIQGTITQYVLNDRDFMQRDASVYAVVGIFLWIASLLVGPALLGS